MFLDMLDWYFKERLEELSTIMAGDESEIQDEDGMGLDERTKVSYGTGQMEIDDSSIQGRFSENNKLVKNIGKVVRDLRNLGFTSMTEDAYASAIFLLLKVKIWSLFALCGLAYISLVHCSPLHVMLYSLNDQQLLSSVLNSTCHILAL